ncbi:translation protein [Zopfochytrium polystomum]|nr:translation protein [Zopfochytrium polystomum]
MLPTAGAAAIVRCSIRIGRLTLSTTSHTAAPASSATASAPPAYHEAVQRPFSTPPPTSLHLLRVQEDLAQAASRLPITRAAARRLIEFPQLGVPHPVPTSATGAGTTASPTDPAAQLAILAARRRRAPTNFTENRHPHGAPPPPVGGILSPLTAAKAEAGTTALPTPQWTPSSTRTGMFAIKRGMTTLWDEWGQMTPCTVLEIPPTTVVHSRFSRQRGAYVVTIGSGRVSRRRMYQVKKPVRGMFRRFGVEVRRKVTEFKVSKDAVLPTGVNLTVAHFVPGQYIDAQGKSRGKGFQGVIKRWGFGGLNASHGTSLTHRSLGSTGQRNQPGKVFKGKKMPGRMGGKTSTVHSLKIVKIDTVHNLLYVKGAVPGAQDKFVRIRDAIRRLWHGQCFPPGSVVPFPTFMGREVAREPRELLPPPPQAGEKDPLARARREVEK